MRNGIYIYEEKKSKFLERRSWRILFMKDGEIIYEETAKGIFSFVMKLVVCHKKRDNIIMEAYL